MQWMRRIARSRLSVDEFFERHDVPFSRAQYFRYKRSLAQGKDRAPTRRGRKKKIGDREELYLRGVVASGAIPSVDQLRDMVEDEFGLAIGRTVMRRTIDRLLPERDRPAPGRPRTRVLNVASNALGGFELIIAVAYHLKWPERVATVIADCVHERQRKINEGRIYRDHKDRDDGRFTADYNQRDDVRTGRFASIDEKRERKRWASMAVMQDQDVTLARKSLAILSLPVVTANGSVRSVNLALGQALEHLCGFNYKQSTVTKFLSELKYLGAAERLLRDLSVFWKECWGEEAAQAGPITCYYVDGNTKAVWSSKRIKQNKVTMLGTCDGLPRAGLHSRWPGSSDLLRDPLGSWPCRRGHPRPFR